MGPAAYALLRRLADGRTHSGQKLADAFGVSRAAVWKRVGSIRAAGLHVASAPGIGYRLERGLELLDAGRIRAALGPRAGDRGIAVFPVVDSTNRWLADRARAGADSGALCLAEMQTAGRGRRGRAWVSPFGANLYLSMLWRFEQGAASLGGLSLAAAVGTVRALESKGMTGAAIKWPNDLYFDGRKLAGLLVEISGENTGPCRAVIGLGLNLRMPESARRAVGQPLAELVELPGADAVGRNELAAAVIGAWDEALDRFAREGLAPFLDDYRRLDLTRGRDVTLDAGAGRYQGTALGVDGQGRLRIRLAQGERAFAGGEVSLRLAPDRSRGGRTGDNPLHSPTGIED